MGKKQRFVVVSDVHGFYDEMMEALNKVNFNPETDFLISCGDEWDRGKKPFEVMRFLYNLDKKAIIRGNHTELFENLCLKGFPEWHDYSNGTVETVQALGGIDSQYDFDLCCSNAYSRTRLYRSQMVNYFETKNYIFVHSFLPLLKSDWRKATQEEWNQAMWSNPFDMMARGLNHTGKTIVFGHWATEHKWAEVEGRTEFGNGAKFDPYYGDGFIAIDACTAHSGKVNAIVIEDEFLEGKSGRNKSN